MNQERLKKMRQGREARQRRAMAGPLVKLLSKGAPKPELHTDGKPIVEKAPITDPDLIPDLKW